MQEQVGRRVRELRKALGLTQEQAAEKVETNTKYFGAIERGEVNLTLELVGRICTAFEVPAAELFRDAACPRADDASAVEQFVRALVDQGDADRLARLRLFLEHVFR